MTTRVLTWFIDHRLEMLLASLAGSFLLFAPSQTLPAGPVLLRTLHTMVFFGGILVLLDVLQAKQVARQSILAVRCAYLLIGIAFAHVYSLVEAIAPGSFAANRELQPELQDAVRRFFILTYFSLSTLTTVSFGDILPGADVVRAIAMIEASIGQFYIVILVSTLVGKRVALLTAPNPDPRD